MYDKIGEVVNRTLRLDLELRHDGAFLPQYSDSTTGELIWRRVVDGPGGVGDVTSRHIAIWRALRSLYPGQRDALLRNAAAQVAIGWDYLTGVVD